MSRVLVVVPFPMSEEQLALRARQAREARLPDGMELVFRPVRVAPANYSSEHDSVFAEIAMIEAGMSAQEDGFDAVCIDTMSDSGVAALRSMLDIPVVGPGRVSMTTAAMLGERFSILMMWDRWRYLYKKNLAELGFGWRCASMRSIGITPNNRSLLSGKEEEVFPLLLEAARRCIDEDGADVILLGSTTMHQAHEYLSRHLEVPVINPGPLSYRAVEQLLALGLRQSRSAYPTSLQPQQAMLTDMVDAALLQKGGA
ncbi:MAG: aspartate/glutamate racemase family protein [Mesorhizobium sp.]